ncbi:MAG TPA: hypothetical protein VMY80_12915, partial [Anaerolineae bacterium]|nr:hypothetical protein [Anaerolineae bacterium]
MKASKNRERRLLRTLLPGVLALLVTAGLSLVFFRLQALAEPAAEITALSVDKTVNKTVATPGEILTYTI